MKNVSYASTQVYTSSNIAYVMGVIGRYLRNHDQKHWTTIKRVIRYLQDTKNYMLTYRKSNDLTVIGYWDFDFTNCLDDHKLASKYIFIMTGGAVSWKSVKQSLTTTSTMEVEYVTGYEAT